MTSSTSPHASETVWITSTGTLVVRGEGVEPKARGGFRIGDSVGTFERKWWWERQTQIQWLIVGFWNNEELSSGFELQRFLCLQKQHFPLFTHCINCTSWRRLSSTFSLGQSFPPRDLDPLEHHPSISCPNPPGSPCRCSLDPH